MELNLGMFREFVKFFKRNDVDHNELKSNLIGLKDIGKIKVKTPAEEITFPLSITDRDDGSQSAYMAKMTNGDIHVVLHIDYFCQVMEHDFFPIFTGTIAHEVGHYLAGHFNGGIINEYLNVKEEVQRFFASRYQETKSLKDEHCYMRSVAASLLKGGVFNMELQADLQALHFVSLSDLIHTHSIDLDNKENIFPVMEKVNRINLLNKIVSDKPVNREGYELHIEFYKNF